ncbi:MAG: acetyltransferase [Magnetococcales bacterium]|nr:acetyltransferase [Magnetococcales bacterium]
MVFLGGGGHARVLRDLVRALGWENRLLGILDRNPAVGESGAWPVLGGDEYLDELNPQTVQLVNGVGNTWSSTARQAVFAAARGKGFRFLTLVHPSAIVAPDVILGEGAQIMAGAVLQTGCRMGENAIVNTRAVLDHDTRLGAHGQVAPGAVLCGGVQTGDRVHVGAGATVIQSVRLGHDVVVGAGALVLRDVPDGQRVAGVPAKIL